MASSYLDAVRYLAKSFRAGVPLRTALDSTAERFGSLAWDTSEAQTSLINETVLYTPGLPRCDSPFTFGAARCKRFLRLLMDEIDRDRIVELDEHFVEYAAMLCQSKSTSHQEFSYIMFEVPTGRIATPFRNLTVRGSHRFNDLGYRVWEAGLLLCALLFDVRSELRKYFEGRRVLEIGAGTGLSAVAYVDAGVDYALLTDCEETIVANMKCNVAANVGASYSIETCVLDATDPAGVADIVDSKNIDIVVAADVTYDNDLLVTIVKTFELVVATNRIGFLVVTCRNESTVKLLQRHLIESGLRFQVIRRGNVEKAFDYLVGWDFSAVSVYQVRKGDV